MSIAKAIQEKRLHATAPKNQEVTSELIDMDLDLLEPETTEEVPAEDPAVKRRKQLARVIANVNAKSFR